MRTIRHLPTYFTVFPNNIRGKILWMIWELLVDIFAWAGLLPIKNKHTASDIDGLTPLELKLKVIDSYWDCTERSASRAVRISTGTIYKSVLPHEVQVMELVARHTTIPVPLIHCVDSLPPPETYLDMYMEYIHGNTLQELWPTMSWWRRLLVVMKLRLYIRQFRNVPFIPGMPPQGIFWEFADCPSKFNDGLEMQALFRDAIHAHDMTLPAAHEPRGWDKLVLCHMDIHPGNVILDEDGQVWLIDFDCAGFYPEWMEAVNGHLVMCSGRQALSHPPHHSFTLLVFLLCGWHWDEINWWEQYSPAWYPAYLPLL